MSFISLNTAISLIGLSKRTLWRRIAEGALRTQPGIEPGEATRVALEDVLSLSPLRLAAEDEALIVDADAGNAEAECDLGLLLLSQDRAPEAVRWLARAADRLYPEAMHQLGRCYLVGRGVAADRDAGMSWIGRAAARGHVTADAVAAYLKDNPPPALLDAALDAIEQRVILGALDEGLR